MICSDVLAESGESNILFEKRPNIMINDSDTESSIGDWSSAHAVF